MKNILLGIVVSFVAFLSFKSCMDSRNNGVKVQESSKLIQEQISNVSKLIVTEGHFAEVYNYKDSKEIFGPFITRAKKALVVVNAEVTVAYDLAKMDYELDEKNKILRIKKIPKAEIKINPDFEYYDISADFLNPFDASDYNTIKNNVNASLLKKVEASSLISNSENRLISELSKFYVLTNSLEWTLIYNGNEINSFDALQLTNQTLLN